MKSSSSSDKITTTPDSHLQNPIRRENRKLFVQALLEMQDKETGKKGNSRIQKTPAYITELAKVIPVPIRAVDIDSEKIYGLILSDIYNPIYPICPEIRKILPTVWANVQEYVIKHAPLKAEAPIYCTEVPLNSEVMRMYSLKYAWESIRITMQKMRIQSLTRWKRVPMSPSSEYSMMYISQHYAVLSDSQGGYWLLDYDQIMMLCDTISGRIFSYLYLLCTPPQMKYRLDPKVLLKIYQKWDLLFSNYGNDSYTMIKNWEPIIQGIMLDKHDPLASSSEFLMALRREPHSHIKSAIEDILALLESLNLNIYQLGELHGIYRHWGHPTVDEEAGCAKVQNIVKSRTFPDPKKMKKAKAMFSRQFCISFCQKEGRWPRIDTDNMNKKSPLYKVIVNHNTNVNFYSPRFNIHDWSTIEFQQEFDFDYHIDFVDVCDDKAISPYLFDVPTIYAREVLGWNPPRPISSRRVLLEMLRKQIVDPVEICQRIMNRELPESWYVILVHAKEREMKIEPRLFAMMVLEMRIYYCITESNISHTVFPYFPQQTMTLSETELTKRLYTMASNEIDAKYVPIFMSIDFKSWNIHWQYLTTVTTFSQLDQLFGTPGLYTFSHIFFQEAHIFLSSRFNPPLFLRDLKDHKHWFRYMCPEERYWTKHLGGFEGIRQKGWTLITILLLLIVELSTGTKSYIIGQGDNQFLKIMLPSYGLDTCDTLEATIKSNQKEITARLGLFTACLESVAKDFNLVIKTEESWYSSCIVNYGKDILYRGAYLSQGLKRISRTMPDINDLYPTIATKISSLQTTGLSTAQKSYDLWGPFFICNLETVIMMFREVKVSLLQGVSHSNRYLEWIVSHQGIQFILHGDTNCLSIPIISPLTYLYRGHPDPLTAYLSSLTMASGRCLHCKNILVWLLRQGFKVGRGDPELLIHDPLSLNIESPPLLAHIFKDQIFKKIQKITKNVLLREIFRTNSEKEDAVLYKYLLDLNPLFPRLLHEIMLQTPAGTRLHIISKFSSARTVQSMLDQRELKSFYSKIVRSEINFLKHYVNTSHDIYVLGNMVANLPKVCPTNLASWLRNETWNKAIDGRVIQGVTVPHPIHQFALNCAQGNQHASCRGREEYMLFALVSPCHPDLIHSRGPHQPFSGHRTQEKRSGRVFQIPTISRPLQAAERIIQLFTWCVTPDEYMTKFFSDLISTRTNVPPEILELTSGTITSGSQVHRLNDHFTKRGVLLNSRPNVSSYVYMSTDNMGKYSRGSDNMNMHFQGAMVLGLAYIQHLALYNTPGERIIMHLHFSCLDCEEFIPDIKVACGHPPPEFPKYSKNPLLYREIQDYPSLGNMKSLSFKIVNSGPPSHAVAYLIFSRILQNISQSAWGLTQQNKVYSTKISVRFIIDIGIDIIMRDLATIIYLYFDQDQHYILSLFTRFQYEMWQDLGSACLMPEVLPTLFLISNNSYQPQLYESLTGVCRMLTKTLSIMLSKIRENPTEHLTNLTHFIVKGVGLNRIFRIWANYLYIKSRYTVDLRALCRDLKLNTSLNFTFPSQDALMTLDNTIANSQSIAMQRLTWRLFPLQLSRQSPESILGMSVIPMRKKAIEGNIGLGSFKMLTFANTTFGLYYEVPLLGRSASLFNLAILDDIIEPPTRTFVDHSYHLVHNLSSSYLKLLQIISAFSIPIRDRNCVCLADGEGSMSKLCFILSKKPVLYNSIHRIERAVAHRGVNMVPGEFVSHSAGVYGVDITLLYGGDLTDPVYFHELCRITPQGIVLTTCDAEIDQPFDSKSQIQIACAVIKHCFISKSEWLIHKFFVNSVYASSQIISILNTVYNEIYLVTPIFSSHESYEIYAVCRGFSPVVDGKEIGKMNTDIQRALWPFFENIQSSRVKPAPFQDHQSVWKDLLNTGLQLGFSESLSYHWSRLVDHTQILEASTGNNLLEDIVKAIEIIQGLINSEWNSMHKFSVGKGLSSTEKILIACTTSLHTELDKMCTWYNTFKILQKMLPLTRQEILGNLEEVMSSTYHLVINTKRLYTSHLKKNNLRRDIVRSLWTLWGHHNLSGQISIPTTKEPVLSPRVKSRSDQLKTFEVKSQQ